VRRRAGEGRSQPGWAACLAGIYAVGIAGTVVVVLLAQTHTHRPLPRLQLGTFAGYTWNGRATSVAARWRVPRIARRSGSGFAGTWIGAQAPGNSGPFIQIGVNEQRVPFGGDQYEAFWSDTELHFHPQSLFMAGAGDEISARMTLVGDRWRLSVVDVSADLVARFSTRQETRGSFNEVEWMQENVSYGPDSIPYHYPRVAGTHFTHLDVNGTAPLATQLLSSWMSPRHRHGYLAPSGLRSNSFEIGPGRLSMPAYDYVRAATIEDNVESAFDDGLGRWSASTPRSQMSSEAAPFRRVVHSDIRGLDATEWPPDVQPVMARLVGALRELLVDTSAAGLPPPSAIGAWRTAWYNDEDVLQSTAGVVRSELGAPTFAFDQ